MSAAPLRIVIPLHDFALGGTERIAVRLAGAWARAGAEVVVVCTRATGPLRALLDPAVAVVTLGSGSRGTIGRRVFARACAAWVSRDGADVVFVPGNFHWPAARALRRTKVAVVAQVSAALDKPQRGRLRQAAFEWWAAFRLARVDAVVTLSDRARLQIDVILGRSVGMRIPLPALADDMPLPVPTPPGPAIVMAAGRLVPEKGFATLIEAFARLPSRTARLRIVGAGPDEARLRGAAAALGIADRVELPGYAADIRPHLDTARLFVLSSHFEGFPAVLVEALGAGRPVVATDCTPATVLLDDPAVGCVVPIEDATAMAAAIDAMLATPPPDPDMLAALVGEHRMAPVARAYLDLFERVRR